MRRWVVAAAVAGVMMIGAVAQASEPFTLHAKISAGNGDVDSAFVDPEFAGTWTFVAEVSGPTDEVMLQLWRPASGGRCAGTDVGSVNLSGSTAKPYKTRNVTEGTHSWTVSSDSADEHCARVILWGEVGAEAIVTVTPPPDPNPPSLVDGLIP